MTEQEWRDSLKAGDDVAVKKNGTLTIHGVEKSTPQKIFTKYHHFSRRTGYGHDLDGSVEICPVTPELKQATEDHFERKRLRGIIGQALQAASTETLRAMAKALTAASQDVPEPCENEKRFRPGGFVPRPREENEPQ